MNRHGHRVAEEQPADSQSRQPFALHDASMQVSKARQQERRGEERGVVRRRKQDNLEARASRGAPQGSMGRMGQERQGRQAAAGAHTHTHIRTHANGPPVCRPGFGFWRQGLAWISGEKEERRREKRREGTVHTYLMSSARGEAWWGVRAERLKVEEFDLRSQ